jgi:hypothetical protein
MVIGIGWSGPLVKSQTTNRWLLLVPQTIIQRVQQGHFRTTLFIGLAAAECIAAGGRKVTPL